MPDDKDRDQTHEGITDEELYHLLYKDWHDSTHEVEGVFTRVLILFMIAAMCVAILAEVLL